MAQSIRSYAAAGAAIAVAGAVAVSPTPAQALPDRTLASVSPAIQLTTTADPFTVWLETFETTYANFTALTGAYFEAPFPVVQQVAVNWLNYVTLLPDIGAIFDDVVKNAQALIANQTAAQTGNLTGLHGLMYEAIVGLVPAELKPVIDYTTNYNSGMVVGALGPIVSPILALGDQLTEFVDELAAGDFTKAINALVNIPAAMTGAFFNGHGILDLTFLAGLIPPQEGIKIEEIGLAMGGLLTPAGSLFNSLDLLVELGDNKLPVPGVKAGLLGSWFAANQSSAEAIGWSGEGNPLAALAKTEEKAPAAASTALAAVDTVPPSVLDSESAALSVDLASDAAEGDVESDGSEADPSTTDSDAAETDADAESVADADAEADADAAAEAESGADADAEGAADAEAEAEGDADAEGGAESDSSADADSDSDGGADSSTASD